MELPPAFETGLELAIDTRPLFTIYVVWHPLFAGGQDIARHLFDHYRRDLYRSVIGGAGLPVIYRSMITETGGVPRHIDFDSSELTATVLLIDDYWISDPAWFAWAKELDRASDSSNLRTLVFPIAIVKEALTLDLATNALRWYVWDGLEAYSRLLRLTTDLTYQFTRMLRLYLLTRGQPEISLRENFKSYLARVQLFLSHSKHDPNGMRIATAIRDAIQAGEGLSSFFDVHDIPVGLRFDDVILESVRESAVVAIQTDSYSSRTWCRKEVLEAKRHQVPLVVADCIDDCDERAFPYLGNVPVVRIDPKTVDRVDVVVARLLDEVLKSFFWKCWVALVQPYATDDDVFLPRAPEILSLAHINQRSASNVLVYPEPPLSADELAIFAAIDGTIRLRSMIEWIAERGK